MTQGYDYTPAGLLEAVAKMQFPERAPRELPLLAAWILRHAGEYDRYTLSVRVGHGIAPDPSLPQSSQDAATFSTKKRIDILAWRGNQPYIFEVKKRLIPAALGQLLTYAHLWSEENPDALPPILGAIAETSDDDTTRVLREHGVTVYLVTPAAAG
jgi:hypothetical protein